jgi:hypothetical protein
MIWLAWRQLRLGAVFAGALTIAIVVVLAATRPEAVQAAGSAITSDLRSLRLLGSVLVGVPAFIGAFWGAPLLAREFEAGTHQLIWTQSITRTRWLATKLAVTGSVAIVVTGLYSFAFTWWSQPLDRFDNRIAPATFAQRGIAPVAYTVFALALGVLAGTVLRRTLPAMAVTILGFGVVRFAFQEFVRTHLLPTSTAAVPTDYFSRRSPSAVGARDWILSSHPVNRNGHALADTRIEQIVRESCHIARSTTPNDLTRCVDGLGIHDLVSMHPASQFWALQAVEAACFVTLAALLAALCFVRLRRHAM